MAKLSEQKPHSVLLDLVFSIAIPSFILSKGVDYFPNFDPILIFCIALSFPILYGLYDFFTSKNFNIISVAGFLNVLLTGGIGLMQASKPVIILKEVGFPLIVGSLLFIYREKLLHFIEKNAEDILDLRKILMHTSQKKLDEWYYLISKQISYPFFLSALLNGIITYIIIQSVPGSQEFNEEIAQLLVYSFVGIALPCMIYMFFLMFRSISKLQKMTGLKFEELFKMK